MNFTADLALAFGTATLERLGQCNVGEKHHVLSCALLPNKTGSLQLDLEFDEAEDVISSIIGIRYVSHWYYVRHNGHSNMQDDSCPYVIIALHYQESSVFYT
ncbi:putative peptidylprolyl isomerase [Helianthus anomalus]